MIIVSYKFEIIGFFFLCQEALKGNVFFKELLSGEGVEAHGCSKQSAVFDVSYAQFS